MVSAYGFNQTQSVHPDKFTLTPLTKPIHSTMLKLLLPAVAITFFIFSAFARAEGSDILSKKDASALFTTSKNQWNANVKAAVIAGLAKATQSADGTLTQYVLGEGWILGVLPLYSEKDFRTPIAIQVSSSYRPSHPLIALFENDVDAAPAICRRASDQMQPEFLVECSSRKVGGGMMFIFTIRENIASQQKNP